ncbi:hypothetical protein PMAYCL1PPCAC_02225, partial [Pristionchus mayeri]
GRSPKSESSLISHLLSDYNPDGRPVRDHRKIVYVTVEQQEQIKILLWFPQSWTDEFLVWNETEWDGIKRVNIPTTKIWLPDGYIFDTVDMKEPLVNLNARVSSNGSVEVDFNKLLDLRCELKVLDFPFDEQRCIMEFSSWSYQIDQLLHVSKEPLIPSEDTNSEWAILSMEAETKRKSYGGTHGQNNEYEEIHFLLKIRRKPLYYIVVILIPTFVIVNVSIIGIFTPHGVQGDREEKVSLGLTTLLTMAVILDMVTGEMPKSAAGLPLLGRFILAETVICVLAIAVSVFTIFIHERVLYLSREPPKWIDKWMRENTNKEEIHPLLIKSPCIEELRSCLDDLRTHLREMKRDEEIKIVWQRIFSLVDIVAMLLLLLSNFLLTFFMFRFAIPS